MIKKVFRVIGAVAETIMFLPFALFSVACGTINELYKQLKRLVEFEIDLFDGALKNGAHIDLSIIKKRSSGRNIES